ncbi:MAG: hypothetical protein D6712_21165 [Chloroflexi bacterium]|nr:MAG: hypothetical protein D6712_21165 [Chloroflexota bacterium]
MRVRAGYLHFWTHKRSVREDGTLTPKGLEDYKRAKIAASYSHVPLRGERVPERDVFYEYAYRFAYWYGQKRHELLARVPESAAKRMASDGVLVQKVFVRDQLAVLATTGLPRGAKASRVRFEWLPPNHPLRASGDNANRMVKAHVLAHASPKLLADLIDGGSPHTEMLCRVWAVKRHLFPFNELPDRFATLLDPGFVQMLGIDKRLPDDLCCQVRDFINECGTDVSNEWIDYNDLLAWNIVMKEMIDYPPVEPLAQTQGWCDVYDEISGAWFRFMDAGKEA